jgi:hypothetical protein
MQIIKQNEMDESVLMTRALSLFGYIDALFQDHGRKPLSERALAIREFIRKELKSNPYNTKDPEKGYYHQFFLTEVLGEEVLQASNLTELHESITDGHFSGETGQSPITWTNKALTEELLMAQASDPTFLNKNSEDFNQE